MSAALSQSQKFEPNNSAQIPGAGPIEILRVIGEQLKNRVYPNVMEGGFVVPSKPTFPFKPLGKETDDVRSRKKRSTTGSWQRPSSGERETSKPWTSRQASKVIEPSIQAAYASELDTLLDAYPSTQFWHDRDGFWLLTESQLLPNLGRKAVFLCRVSMTRRHVRSWGFWSHSIIDYIWIGPRHTNFPDGSICAFDPNDNNAWVFGEPIIDLLDIYCLWATQHLHLEIIGSWPGPQSANITLERILEIKDDEYCGCGTDLPYKECCKEKDRAANIYVVLKNYILMTRGGHRFPPDIVLQFMHKQNHPPEESLLLP